MSVYNRSIDRNSLSTIARMHAARDRHEAFEADKADEYNVLKRRVRAEMSAGTRVADEADRLWHAANDAIPAPAAVGSARLHPSRVRALVRLVAEMGWSSDPAESIEPTLTREEALAQAQAETNVRLKAAIGALDAYEDDRRREALGLPERLPEPEPAPLVVPPAPRRGRPPKVILDPNAMVLPD